MDCKAKKSFSQLNFLYTAPVLSYPYFKRGFILQTDASDMGVGTALTQYDPSGQKHVISYASRSLSDRENQPLPQKKRH